MSEKEFEATSALMDGEQDIEISGLTDRDEAMAKWQRYHLIRDSLSGHLPESVSLDLHQRIHDTIANEPTVLAPKQKQLPVYIKPVAGLAIAASVTAAVLIGVQTFQSENSVDAPSSAIALQQTTPTIPSTRFVSFESAQDSDNSQAEERMNRYMMNYNELKASGGVRGVPPYVRMVGYEAQ